VNSLSDITFFGEYACDPYLFPLPGSFDAGAVSFAAGAEAELEAAGVVFEAAPGAQLDDVFELAIFLAMSEYEFPESFRLAFELAFELTVFAPVREFTRFEN